MTPVVLADDHAILRAGLRGLIDAQPDLKVVGEAATGPDAVARVGETGARVLCLDLSMPGAGWADTIRRVREACPAARVLVLTMHDDPAYLRAAVAAGADGYMLKSSPPADLLTAVRRVAAGLPAIDPALKPSAPNAPPAGTAVLSRREREVLELLARGHTHQEIADKLFVSVKTVETYRARVKEKTGLQTRADFVRYGAEAGLLQSPPPAAADG
jgi:two-component system, NarL family, response regulator NreC